MRGVAALALFGWLACGGCGPIFGQVMRAAEGVNRAEVVEGSLPQLTPGSEVLVLGPFAITDAAFYVCRGEDASNWAASLGEAGGVVTRLYLASPGESPPAPEALGGLTEPQAVADQLGIPGPPRWLLFGTVVRREMLVAPLRGVIMAVEYRISVYDSSTGELSVVEIGVREPFEECVPSAVAAFLELARGV